MGFNKKDFFKKLKNKYQVTILNRTTLAESHIFSLTRLNVLTYVGVFVIILSILIGLLLVFTPFNYLLPLRKNSQLSRQLFENAIKLDSLKKEVRIRDQYFENIQNVMLGRQVNNFESIQDTSSFKHEKLEFSRSKHDSILRKQIEKEEKQSLSVLNNSKQKNVSLKNLHFFLPIKGIVTNGFNIENGHLATDIVAQPNEPVLATLEGTVTLATWSLSEGYIIMVQHNYNIISIYKHNESLLKKQGDHVTAGEPIAIIGNTGELTTGPHLHFELWYNGSALNPEDYIAF
ncbi:MAG: M23 family peptidase [Bacteroidetes bacterium]|nr:MAG: M23 family peptidase [Bacteroidota bacterium]